MSEDSQTDFIVERSEDSDELPTVSNYALVGDTMEARIKHLHDYVTMMSNKYGDKFVFIEGAHVIVVDQKDPFKLLIIRESPDKHCNLIGGTLNKGEEIVACLERELREEVKSAVEADPHELFFTTCFVRKLDHVEFFASHIFLGRVKSKLPETCMWTHLSCSDFNIHPMVYRNAATFYATSYSTSKFVNVVNPSYEQDCVSMDNILDGKAMFNDNAIDSYIKYIKSTTAPIAPDLRKAAQANDRAAINESLTDTLNKISKKEKNVSFSKVVGTDRPTVPTTDPNTSSSSRNPNVNNEQNSKRGRNNRWRQSRKAINGQSVNSGNGGTGAISE